MLLVLELPHHPPVLVPCGTYSALGAVWPPLCPAGEAHMPKLRFLLALLFLSWCWGTLAAPGSYGEGSLPCPLWSPLLL